MPPSDLLVILDENSPNFVYHGAGWQTSSLSQWYGGTARHFDAEVAGAQSGSFSLVFEGHSVAFYGTAPAQSLVFTISIDNGPATQFNHNGGDSSSYSQWYQSPELLDGSHNITISNIYGTTLDCAMVSVTPNTPLHGRTAIVDSDSSLLEYRGGWIRNTHASGSSFFDANYHSWTAGDSFVFRFTGTSVAVYGLFSWGKLGTLSTTYTLDGSSPSSESYSVTTNTPEFLNAIGDVTNFLFYSRHGLSTGQHTLTMNVTQSVNQSFILDYITYAPSFSTFNQILSSSLPVSTSLQPSRTGAIDGGRRIETPSSTFLPVEGGSGSQKRTLPLALILGASIGGAVLIILFILGFWSWRRRYTLQRKRLGGDQKPLLGTPSSAHFSTKTTKRNTTEAATPFTQLQTRPEASGRHAQQPLCQPVSFPAQRRTLTPASTRTPGHDPTPLTLAASGSRANVNPSMPLTPLRRQGTTVTYAESHLVRDESHMAVVPSSVSTHRPKIVPSGDAVQRSRSVAPLVLIGSPPASAASTSSLFPSSSMVEQINQQLTDRNSSVVVGPRPRIPTRSRPPEGQVNTHQRLSEDLPQSAYTSSIRHTDASSHPPLLELEERLTPLRPDSSITAAFLNHYQRSPPTSPLASLIPHLTSILRRGSSRPSPSLADECDVPPAYHTLSNRQSRSYAS